MPDSFTFDVQDAPPVLQMPLIDLQSNSDLQGQVRGKGDELGQFFRELPPSLPEFSSMFKQTLRDNIFVLEVLLHFEFQ